MCIYLLTTFVIQCLKIAGVIWSSTWETFLKVIYLILFVTVMTINEQIGLF